VPCSLICSRRLWFARRHWIRLLPAEAKPHCSSAQLRASRRGGG
jgi:hypothetical protein